MSAWAGTIKQLRQCGGTATPYGYTVVVVFRIDFLDSEGLGEDWPGGDPAQCFAEFNFNHHQDDDTRHSAFYLYPNLDTCESTYQNPIIWQDTGKPWAGEMSSDGDYNPFMRMVSMRTLGRESPGLGRDLWTVECTYEHKTGGVYVNTRVVPFFIPETQTQQYGQFKDFYHREQNLADDHHDNQGQKGGWVKQDIENRSLSDRTQPMPICNSAMVPHLPQLKKTVHKQAYRYSWTSQIALNFDEYVNRVNKDEFILKGYNGNLTDVNSPRGAEFPHQKEHNPSDFTTKPRIVTTFCKKFEPRTLLLQTVNCSPKRHRGRTLYDYELIFKYDEDEHDVFILDEGKTAHAIAPQTGDGRGDVVRDYVRDSPPTGGAAPEYKVQAREESVQMVSSNGNPSRETSLLNGKGQRLAWRARRSGEQKYFEAVYLRYKIYEDAPFGKCRVIISRDNKPEGKDVPWGGYIQEDYSLVAFNNQTQAICPPPDN